MGTKSARQILEAAIASHLSAQTELAGVYIYTGDGADTNVLPKAIVLCDSARAPNDLPQGLGNYSCGTRITVFSSADDNTLAQHRARCAAVAGAMQDLTAIQASLWLGAMPSAMTLPPSPRTKG